jgi:hypothetical protein
MSKIINRIQQIKKEYEAKIAAEKDGLRKEIVDVLVSAKQMLSAAPDDIRREILEHKDVRGLLRAMGGSGSNGGATGKRGKLPTDDLIAYCKGTPRSNTDINNHFAVKNCSNKVNTLKKDGKLEKTKDGKWLAL